MLLHEYMEYFAREVPDQLCVAISDLWPTAS
jgi:hypothetical protein